MEFFKELMKSFDEELDKIKIKNTPVEGEESGKVPEEGASDASRNVKDDIENLGDKTENRAVQGTNAWVPESVKSEPEQTGTAEPLEDGRLRKIIAPVKKEASEETSPRKNKAKILSAKARGGSEAEMS